MTVFDDFKTLLETTGSKVFATKKVDSVKQAIVYRPISQKIYGSMSGRADLKSDRVQVSCFAVTEPSIKKMERTVENLLSFYSGSFVCTPTESKVEGFDDTTSTFYSHRDYFVMYKE